MASHERTAPRRPVLATCLAVLALSTGIAAAVATPASAGVALDPDFGSGGTVVLPVSPGSNADEAFALVPDAEGRILIAGYSSVPHQRMVVVRLDASGTPDPSFGGTGIVALDVGVRARAQAIALDGEGRIVVAGFGVLVPSGVEQFVAARLLDDGTLDASFGAGGVAATSFGTRDARALAVAVQADDGVVLAGWARNSSNRDVALVRYAQDGTIDPGFGNGGKATYGVGAGNDEAMAVAVDDTDRIVLAGYAADGSTYDLLAGRLTASGAPDASFAGTGFRRVSVSDGVEQANALLLQSDGAIVLAGQSKIGGGNRFAFARVDTSGTLDPSFGTGGVTVTSIGELAEARAIAPLTRGRFVAAGRARLPGGRIEMVVARYLASGVLDPTFGDGGRLLFALGVKNDEAYAVATGAVGTILVAGSTRTGNDPNFGIARLVVDECVLPDADDDGVCDQQDVCPLDPDPLQSDADGDGLGDACDACNAGVTLERPTLRLGNLSTPGGDDFVKVIGTISMTPGTVLDPRTTGARVQVHGADGEVLLEARIPPGAFDTGTKVGWQVNRNGKVLKFRSPVPVDGLVRKLRLVRALTSGRYHIKVTGTPLDLDGLPLDGALGVTVVVDPDVAGRCAELAFAEPAHTCALNEAQTTLVCK